jgi:hypothetical protein
MYLFFVSESDKEKLRRHKFLNHEPPHGVTNRPKVCVCVYVCVCVCTIYVKYVYKQTWLFFACIHAYTNYKGLYKK